MAFKPAKRPRKLDPTNGAVGGSTNTVVHVLAIAGRVGVDITLDDGDRCGRDISTNLNLQRSSIYLVEGFFYPGGSPVVLKRLAEDGNLHQDALTVSGETIWPKGFPGMAEVGNTGLPPKVLKKWGFKDMSRISDARMAGTAYGTVILHTSPEAAAGGPLAVVRTGGLIEVDVANRRLYLEITDAELAERLAHWEPTHERADSGYAGLQQPHVEGAGSGAHLDFLKGCRGAPVRKDSC